MGVDRYRVCELYAEGPDVEGSGSGYRLVLTARHVVAPAVAGPGGKLRVRPVGGAEWLSARVEWDNADADAALIAIEDERWQAPAGESVLRWGELAGSDPVPCAAVGFPWASLRPDRMRDTAHLYGHLAPLGQLKQGRLDLDVASASPSVREGGSPWAGMSGAGVIADSHLVGIITVDPACYQDRLIAVPIGRLLADDGFRARLGEHGVRAEADPVGAGWYLQLPGGLTVSLGSAYRPVSRRFRPVPSMLLRPEHGLVPFLGREAVLDQLSGWCQGPPGTPVLLVTGGGGAGKTRLGREACVQMMVAGWDAGVADDQRRDGAAMSRLQRPTLVVVDDADLRTELISALVDYLRWDDSGPPVALLLLARAAGAWWDRLVRQQGLDDAYTAVDLDHYPVPLADRAEHFRRASIAFAAYGRPGAQPAIPPPADELDDPAYAEPLLIHIAALLRTADISATPAPGAGEGRAPGKDPAADLSSSARQGLLRALCERERTRWYQLGAGSHLAFNPDLPLADQVVALATLTAAADAACATLLLAALPSQGEVTRLGAEGLATWAHRLYAGPGYWNPLRPDLLAEQHLADTPQLAALASTVVELAAGHEWEARVLTQLLAELTRATPNQPAVRTALDELLAAALPRIVDLAIPGWPYSVVAGLEPGRTSWTLPLDAVRLGPADDETEVTAVQVRDVVARLIEAGHWREGDPAILAVFDAGYDVTRRAWLLADLPVELLGRLRSDRVMQLPAPPRQPGTIGRPRKHGGELALSDPATWPEPKISTSTVTSRYGMAAAAAWDRVHPRLTHRAAWLDHDGDLPVIEGTLIRLQADHLPGDRDPKPVWLWFSGTGAAPGEVDRCWQAFLRRFDLEHTFRFFKQVLGWTAPKIRDPAAADRWTWLIIAACAQLRPARALAADPRLPWERPAPAGRLTPARVRRGFRNIRATIPSQASAPKPGKPGPGRPPGSRNRRPAPRHDVGTTTKRGLTLKAKRERAG